MKKQIVIIFLFTIPFSGFSQNKKEQIETLNLRVDSCKTVIKTQENQLNQLSQDNEKFQSTLKKAENEIKNKQNQILNLETENKNYKFVTDSLKIENNNLRNPRFIWNGKYGEVILENGNIIPKIIISNQNMEGFDYKITFTIQMHDPLEFRVENYLGHASFYNNEKKAKSNKLANEHDDLENIEIIFTLVNDEIFVDIGEPGDFSGEFIQYETILCKKKWK